MESSPLPVICVVLLVIGFGLLQIFARDLMWELTHWNNQVAGRASERTDTWDSWQVVSGVICIFVGVVLGCWVWSASSQRSAENTQRTQTAVAREATQVGIAQTLDEQFRSVINQVSEAATTDIAQAAASEMGVSLAGVTLYYGRCETRDSFYLIVADYQNRDYAYTSSGELCSIPYVYVGRQQELGASAMGGEWTEVFSFRDSRNLIPDILRTPVGTPTRTPAARATLNPTPRPTEATNK